MGNAFADGFPLRVAARVQHVGIDCFAFVLARSLLDVEAERECAVGFGVVGIGLALCGIGEEAWVLGAAIEMVVGRFRGFVARIGGAGAACEFGASGEC